MVVGELMISETFKATSVNGTGGWKQFALKSDFTSKRKQHR